MTTVFYFSVQHQYRSISIIMAKPQGLPESISAISESQLFLQYYRIKQVMDPNFRRHTFGSSEKQYKPYGPMGRDAKPSSQILNSGTILLRPSEKSPTPQWYKKAIKEHNSEMERLNLTKEANIYAKKCSTKSIINHTRAKFDHCITTPSSMRGLF